MLLIASGAFKNPVRGSGREDDEFAIGLHFKFELDVFKPGLETEDPNLQARKRARRDVTQRDNRL